MLATASDELDFDNQALQLSGSACAGSGSILPTSPVAAWDALGASAYAKQLQDGCSAPLGVNGTMWFAEVGNLHFLDSDFSLRMQLANLSGTPNTVVTEEDTTCVRCMGGAPPRACCWPVRKFWPPAPLLERVC